MNKKVSFIGSGLNIAAAQPLSSFFFFLASELRGGLRGDLKEDNEAALWT